MTRAEYKALRAFYRTQWTAEADLRHRQALRKAWRFLGFTIAATIVAFVVALVRG